MRPREVGDESGIHATPESVTDAAATSPVALTGAGTPMQSAITSARVRPAAVERAVQRHGRKRAARVGSVVLGVEVEVAAHERGAAQIGDRRDQVRPSGVDPHDGAGVGSQLEATRGPALAVLAAGARVGKLAQQAAAHELVDARRSSSSGSGPPRPSRRWR